ncbi:MAG: hypothetical protein L6V93_14275 [Clostridiales bacterium]|nr:MAG: hypothetical protein L6V93_14275 [Clostridiales bacterium]
MNWIKSIIHTTSAGIESVVGGLLNIGINGTQIEDEADFNDFLEHNKEFWDLVDDELIEQKKRAVQRLFLPCGQRISCGKYRECQRYARVFEIV